MEKQMLREISNDDLTPKKRDKLVESELFDPKEDDGLDYEVDSVVITEF
jgi:hypothetical protein|tara:strand:- start:4922 stop:5068 length:147 start_codon:yes stop_codon:yes gene_type:complete